MKIDLPELERKLSYGINLTIKESTILLESMEGFIDDKIELQEQLNTAKKALKEISEDVPKPPKYNLNAEFWRTQWSEASGAHLMEYLRAEKLKKDNEILKKALANIKLRTERDELETYYVERNHDIRKDAIDALAAIGNEGS